MTEWGYVAAGVGAALAVVGVVAAVFRLLRIPVVGPMFGYELVKLARRGQQPRLRVALVLLLLVGLLVTYLGQFGTNSLDAFFGSGQTLQVNEMSKFARNFLIAFLFTQLVAVALITPAVVGGAIAEEKERGTIDYLKASLLTNREIVLGKLAARLAFVGGVVLAGVPVLFLTMLFGGVDAVSLLVGYAVTATAADSQAVRVGRRWRVVRFNQPLDVTDHPATGRVYLAVFGNWPGSRVGNGVESTGRGVWLLDPVR